MNAPLAQREITLAAVALLAIVAVVAGLEVARDQPSGTSGSSGVVTRWFQSQAAPYSFPAKAKRTACGQPAGERTLGVVHPVLPCGAKIVIRFGGQDVLTQVVDRAPVEQGQEFDVTPGLAMLLGLAGVQPVEWRFAVPPEGT